MKIAKRGKILDVDPGEFLESAAGRKILLDIGTGDGRYPYRIAREDVGWMCVGVDPAEKNMIETSQKIGAKPSRGGVENLALIVSTLEELPREFDNIASRASVNFPWGGLQRGVSLPDMETMSRLRALLLDGAGLDVLLNMQVFFDEQLRVKLDLPKFDMTYARDVLAPMYQKAGLKVFEIAETGPENLPRHTSWGGRLAKGSGRSAALIRATAEEKE